MNEIESPPEAGNPPAPSGGVSFLYRQLPYLIVLVLAIVGVAYTNISHEPLVGSTRHSSCVHHNSNSGIA